MKLYEKMREETKKKYRDESKERLKRIYTTKLTTAFIGALAKFEEKFGFLWNNDNLEGWQKEIKQIFKDEGFSEDFFDDIWQEVRNAVLTNGNNQVRALDKEMEQYSMVWERYNATFPVIGCGCNSKDEPGIKMIMPEGGKNG